MAEQTEIILARQDTRIETIVDAVRDLPLLTPLTPLIADLIADPATTIDEVAHTVASDPTAATRFLKMINSAYFAVAAPVTSLTRAMQLLGLSTVYDLLDARSLLCLFTLRRPRQAWVNGRLEGLWRHSIATGVASRLLGMKIGEDPHLFFAAGLLHDIGKAAFLLLQTADYEAVTQVALHDRLPILVAERQVMDTDHAVLGRHLCEAFGQPDELCMAVGRHHQVRAGGVDEAYSTLAAAVHVADIIARAHGDGWWGDRVMPRLSSAARVALHLTGDDADDLLDALDEEYPRAVARLGGLFPPRLLA